MPDLFCIHARAFQEYLEALACPDEEVPARRKRRLLLAYAELRYKLYGGSRCAMCTAPVRHVIPVRVEYANGAEARHPCLCTRCLEVEKAVSRRVVLKIGEATVEYAGAGRHYEMDVAPHPPMRPTRKAKRAAAG